MYGLPVALVWGPRPADEVVETLDQLAADFRTARLDIARSCALAMLGRFDDAARLAEPAAARLRELGEGAYAGVWLAEIAALRGEYGLAVRHGLKMLEAFEAEAQRGFVVISGARVGRWLCEEGRFDEAEKLAHRGRELELLEAKWLWRQVQARVDASRGLHAEAEALAREAIGLTELTDALTWQGEAFLDLAVVLAAADRTDAAVEALEQALNRYGRKNCLAMVAQVESQLETLRGARAKGAGALG
jgi:tetratricopeptide (TPR) repeat protein